MTGLRDIEASLRPTQVQIDQIQRCRTSIENLLRNDLRNDLSFYYAGSYAKKTVINTHLDLDLVVRFPSYITDSTQQCYESVHESLRRNGWNPRRKNAAIQISQNNLPGNSILAHADVVPEKQINNSEYCYLWLNREGRMLQTSVQTHVNAISNSGMHDLIRLLKFWKLKQNLEYPSFILEQCILRWVDDEPSNAASDIITRLQSHIDYIGRRIETIKLVDPANPSSNILTDPSNFTPSEKQAVAETARNTYQYAYNQDWERFFRTRF